ncbi:MAG: DAK2 domain-containing protein, partial [Clostridiales bacterium]|nr:DAK2 domain-containing protein [Clostridiales bacterium]
VMKPAEGTILTVSRVSAEKAVEAANNGAGVSEMFDTMIASAHEALLLTIEQNPVLKKAGVVDAGAFGYIVILEGMQQVLSGKTPRVLNFAPQKAMETSKSADFSSFSTEDIKFCYCTEFIASRDDKTKSIDRLRAFLESIGDSVVAVDDDEIVKVHVHTNKPDRVLSEALKFGMLLSVKIENMKKQHTDKLIENNASVPDHEIAEPEQEYGFVAVAAGDGITSIFKDLGANHVVSGGQTMNPSTEDILLAIDKTPASTVFVLPNNKNIIMAAEQAIPLSSKKVIVLPSKTIPQGISAMLAFDVSTNIEANTEAMNKAIKTVRTGQITYAARDSVFDGSRIREDDFIALVDGKLIHHNKRFTDTVKRLANTLLKKNTTFITIITGCDATQQQIDETKAVFEKAAKDAEITVVSGGQPVYSFIIAAE